MPSDPRAVAIIQARMGSTRLPGKVMLPLGDTTVLGWVIRRVAACARVSEVVVATSVLAEDDVVAGAAARQGAFVFRGSPDNVLSRYCGAAAARQADWIIRVTSDCPLFDPGVLSAMLERFQALAGQVDYLSNAWPHRTFPRGLDAEIFTRAALEVACTRSRQPHELEHVTPYLYQHPDEFRLAGFTQERDQSGYRWTLDTPDDWRLIQAIHQALGEGGRIYGLAEMAALMEARPELAALNAHVRQKALGE